MHSLLPGRRREDISEQKLSVFIFALSSPTLLQKSGCTCYLASCVRDQLAWKQSQRLEPYFMVRGNWGQGRLSGLLRPHSVVSWSWPDFPDYQVSLQYGLLHPQITNPCLLVQAPARYWQIDCSLLFPGLEGEGQVIQIRIRKTSFLLPFCAPQMVWGNWLQVFLTNPNQILISKYWMNFWTMVKDL